MNGLGSIGSLGALSTQATQGLGGSTWTPDSISNLTAWWKINEGAGLIVGDSKNSYHGNVNNMTEAQFWANNGPDGNPVGTFAGWANADVRNITLLNLGASGTAFSLVFVVYRSSGAALSTSYFHIGTVTNNWVATVDDANKGADIRFFYKNTAAAYPQFQTSTNVHANDAWEIWAVGHEYGDGSKAFIYKNGSPVAAAWTGDGDTLPNQSGVTYLGSRAGTLPHLGYMGDMLYYTKLLDGAEISLLYTYLKGRYSL